jgi:prepilin-type processing-associated H-X9-DG protein
MPIPFTCPYCGKTTTVADQYAGQTGPCVSCGQDVTIPQGVSGSIAPDPLGKPLPTTPLATPPPPRAKSTSGIAVVLIVLGAFFGLFLCGGVGVALLLPAIQSAREAARRAQCMNNMRQIGVAMHNYHDAYGTLPPAYIADENGRPMHSWRVLILPYLEQGYVFDQYRFDEPWDSPHNQAVTSVPIPTYCCPSDPGNSPVSSFTNYMVITGPATVFDGDKATAFRDIIDGLSNTLMVVEARGTGRHWAEPVDLDVKNVSYPLGSGAPDSPGSYHPGGLNALFCDGAISFLSGSTPPQVFQALTTRGGGEIVDRGDMY